MEFPWFPPGGFYWSFHCAANLGDEVFFVSFWALLAHFPKVDSFAGVVTFHDLSLAIPFIRI